MPEQDSYEINLQWNNKTIGILSSPVLSGKIEVATPPEFPNGIEGIWSPEHLFVASVNSCLMATFLAITSNSKIEFTNYESQAIGKVEKIEDKYLVTEITVRPKVTIPSGGNEERIKHLFKMSEKACAVSNSIQSKIILNPLVILLTEV